MQVLTGSKREITIMEWREQIEKHVKRANDSMECFRRFSDADSLERLIEDCKQIIYYSQHTKEAIEFMDLHDIK